MPLYHVSGGETLVCMSAGRTPSPTVVVYQSIRSVEQLVCPESARETLSLGRRDEDEPAKRLASIAIIWWGFGGSLSENERLALCGRFYTTWLLKGHRIAPEMPHCTIGSVT